MLLLMRMRAASLLLALAQYLLDHRLPMLADAFRSAAMAMWPIKPPPGGGRVDA